VPRSSRGSGPSRPPSSVTARPHEPGSSPQPTEGSARPEGVGAGPLDTRGAPATGEAAPDKPRFRIFIVDTGWDSPAHRVLKENFALLRDLQKDDPIYVLSREKSIELSRRHQERIGRDPVIAVHDMAAMGESGTTDFHGFRLNLGLMRTPQQALLALQNFVRFLSSHRQSADLEAEIRRDLRREGLAGAIEIILHHEAREIGE
jgi:hypothetical protein